MPPSLIDPKNLQLHRNLLAMAGGTYLVWWFAVELFLPNAYNPLGSRLLVVAAFFLTYVASFASEWVRSSLPNLYTSCLWLLTAHFFFLFWGNGGDNNWVTGAFITVLAVTYSLFTYRALIAYSIFITVTAAGLVIAQPSLSHSLFIPGILTILFQANIGLYTRLRIARRLIESNERVQRLSHSADLQRIRAEAMQDNVRARDEFISLASHELKTPLTSLKLWTQMLERNLRSANPSTLESLRNTAKLVGKQISRLSGLVETMLDVSQISSSELQIHRDRVNFSELVRDISETLKPQSEAQGTPLLVHAIDEIAVMGDASRLTQLIENLLSNAIKYGNHKPIKVTLVRAGANAELRVEDQGMGIEKSDNERIFERFECVRAAGNISGLGLGLYLAKQIVVAHQGSIRVDSQLGHGSTFTVRIPAVD
ncbi:MAG: sensor histidine kinase [Bdellovibrionota bacterium]